MHKDNEYRRVPVEEVSARLAKGWTFGRASWSEEQKQRQSEILKNADHPSRWQKGHQAWNTGEKMPESARQAMSAGQLLKYGITLVEVEAAAAAKLAWCSEHRRFEPIESFHVLKSGYRASRCRNSHKKYDPWFVAQMEKQNGLCAICQQPSDKTLCLDHRHDCSNPLHSRKNDPRLGCECSRGLLCERCNFRLGYFEAMIQNVTISQPVFGSWEQKATDYLRNHQTFI